MAEPPEVLPPSNPGPTDAWARATMWIVIMLILTGGGLYVFKSCRDLPGEVIHKSGEVIDKAGQALADVASAFRRGTVSTSFVSYATTLSNQHYFQFATLKQMEVFSRTEAPMTGFGFVPLPEVVVEARAPVDYTYYLDLNADWRFVLENQTIYVFAPPIRYNKPAVDASALKFEVRKGAFNYRKSEVVENLKATITPLVTLRAKENIPLVRETGRKQTEEFVERWLARSFADGGKYQVRVFFPGEKHPEEGALKPLP